MLEARDLYKTYICKQKEHIYSRTKKTKKEVIKGISLKVEPGQIIGILGINGAGKTTTIKMLTTMIEPTAGTISIDGIDAVKEYMLVKNKINLITGGERNIYWRLTAQENLEYFGSLYGLSKGELKKKVIQVLKVVNLYEAKDIPVEKFSKGMKQRLQIARGLINDPSYIFMDEPTLGLDILIAKELRNYIKKVAVEEKKGIILTTHYILEAEELCDYIYVLDKGKFIYEGTPEYLKNMYKRNYKWKIECLELNKSFVENISRNVEGIVKVHPDYEKNFVEIETVEDNIMIIFELAKKYEVSIQKLATSDMTLEDALMRLMEDTVNEKMA